MGMRRGHGEGLEMETQIRNLPEFLYGEKTRVLDEVISLYLLR